MLDTVMEGNRDGNTSFSDSELGNESGEYKPVSVVTSKTAATKIVSRCIHFGVHLFTKNVFQFLYGEPGDKKEIPKRERTLTKFDVIALVFRPRVEAWSNEETVDPNTLLLVSSFKTIDKHYQYTKKDLEDGAEEEDEGDTYDNMWSGTRGRA
jgi:hypothetical protein